MTIPFLILAVLVLAFANGANDNFKGVATLHGSGRASFRVSVAWAAATTLAGSLVALWLGHGLVRTFSGHGLVPEALVGDPAFAVTVAVGAALTVLAATRLGCPISTTHALVGGLLGGGAVAAGSELRLGELVGSVVVPLLLSPLVAVACTCVLYGVFRRTRLRLGVTKESCVCVSAAEHAPAVARAGTSLLSVAASPRVVVHQAGCDARLSGRVVGLDAQTTLDALHFVSAGAVGFARGVNDTPKIVALLAAGAVLGKEDAVLWVAVAMAIGGLLAARRIARTLSHEITPMNDGQGFTASLVTAGMVLVASRFGMPVSTTHVSVGSLFGIGAITGAGRRRAILSIVGAWAITLPLAAVLAAAVGVVLAG